MACSPPLVGPALCIASTLIKTALNCRLGLLYAHSGAGTGITLGLSYRELGKGLPLPIGILYLAH